MVFLNKRVHRTQIIRWTSETQVYDITCFRVFAKIFFEFYAIIKRICECNAYSISSFVLHSANFAKIVETFFFKQKTAYEIGVRLVGSEMCIRDRTWAQLFRSGCQIVLLGRLLTVSYTHLTLPTNREV